MTEKDSVPLFEQRAVNILDDCKELLRQRGDQYGDTMRDCQWLALRSRMFQFYGIKPTDAQCRVLYCAGLVDQKYQRQSGGYNPDHAPDMINYLAFMEGESREIYKEASTLDASDPLATKLGLTTL